MHRTPWTRKGPASSFASDRLRPKPSPPQSSQLIGQDAVPQQSKSLRTLYALQSSLQDPTTSAARDPTGGCFCQARMHSLSQYTPICISCGLPLCNLASPAHLCPSCSEPLLTPARRVALITQIDAEIAETIQKEQRARERAEEERRAAAGAFPALSAASPAPQPSLSSLSMPSVPPQPKQHKVLSLNSKTKRAVLKTTTTTIVQKTSASSTPDTSRPSSPQPIREPRPVANGVVNAAVDPDRPWRNFKDDIVYVPATRPAGDVDEEATGEGKTEKGKGKRRRGRGKGKTKEEARSGEGKKDSVHGEDSNGPLEKASQN